MVNFGISDLLRKISGKVDKTNTYNSFCNDSSSKF